MPPIGDGTPPSIASEIPLDVLEVIFKSLTPYDLATCCRVSKPVHGLALEALYRDLYPNRRNVLRLCLKLCSDPDRAHFVRTFTLHDNSVDMYLGIISDALLKLPRLHTLVLFIGALSSWILPREGCPFQLHNFSSGFYFDTPMISFLQTQPGLKHLGVSIPHPGGVVQIVHPQLFPNLISIVAPMSVVKAIVPGRPVRSITAFNAVDQLPSISCLSASTSPTGIQRLMLNFAYLQIIGCEQLAQAAPKLINFTIDADRVRPDDDEMLDELTAWIEEYLSYAKDLNCLIIRFYPLLSAVPCQELDFSDMVTSIFAASGKLVHVIITFHGYKAKYVCKQVPGKDWYIVND